MPFTLLRRLECVLEGSKASLLAEYEKVQQLNLPEEAQQKLLLRATGGLSFFNISKMDLSKAIDDAVMDSSDAHQNQMMQVLSDPNRASVFARVVFDMLKVI
ncbi:MAG: hypothetical protein Q9M16_06245 [Mariprofundus sp.]|nr:hypothetical protein [Mariprofundus sp.]